MTGLIASEVRKLRTTRTTWILTAVGIGLIALTTWLTLFIADFGGGFTGTDGEIAAAIGQVGGNSVIVLVVGLLLMTTEFRHGTIGRTLQLEPSRTRVLVSKLVVGVIYAVGFFVLGVLVVGGLAALAAATDGTSLAFGGETWAALWQGPVGLGLTAIFGVAVGSLLRSQVVAITLMLVWVFIVETLIAQLVPGVGRWLPFQALNAMFLNDEALANVPEGFLQPLEPGLALTMFLIYVAVVAAAATVLMRVRDV